MLERRPILGILIGLTLCISIWRITMQEPSMIEAENTFTNQHQQQQQLQQLYQHQYTLEPQVSSAIYTKFGIISKNSIQKQQQQLQSSNSNYNNISTSSSTLSSNNSININFPKRNLNNSIDVTSHHTVSSSMSVESYNLYYEKLPKNDLNRLIDLNDFKFVINQLPCRSISAENTFGTYDDNNLVNSFTDNDNSRTIKNIVNNNDISYENGPLVLILIHSAPNNYKKRLHIRETWGSLDTSLIRIIFLLGAVNDTDQQQKIELENNMFSDIVQGNFNDAYRNMTYKHVMALKWFTYYCPEAKFLLKIDDDVFVNTPYLIDYLNRHSKRSNLLFCEVIFWSRVKRSYRSKWRVSTKEFPGRYYPPYCPGYSIIYSPDIAIRLYQEAQISPYFWIDDVHITGTLPKKLNITITTSSPYLLSRGDYAKIMNAQKTLYTIKDNNDNKYNNNNNQNLVNNLQLYLFLFSWPDIEEKQAKKLWKIIEKLR